MKDVFTYLRSQKRSHVKCEFANAKKFAESLARIEASSSCCQHVCQLFMSRSQTRTFLSIRISKVVRIKEVNAVKDRHEKKLLVVRAY